jgi:hypothetical protein
MRHTALTRMAPYCDPFTLARIAGHSSISITQRYCHPQADAIEAAFSKFGIKRLTSIPSDQVLLHHNSSGTGNSSLCVFVTLGETKIPN